MLAVQAGRLEPAGTRQELRCSGPQSRFPPRSSGTEALGSLADGVGVLQPSGSLGGHPGLSPARPGGLVPREAKALAMREGFAALLELNLFLVA